jgi:hypothetical protein
LKNLKPLGTYSFFTFNMEQLAATNETNRLLALILTELKTSNETARKQFAAAADSVTIGERIMKMIREWALQQGPALGGFQVRL